MVKTAIAFMLGCVVLLQLPQLPHPLWFGLIAPVIVMLCHAHTRVFAYLLLGIMWALLHANLLINDRLSPQLVAKELTITGTINSVPEHNEQRIRFLFTPDPHLSQTLPDKIQLNWYRPLPEQLNAGERWQVAVRLKQPHGMMNPGTFDYEGWLFQQGIGAIGYVQHNKKNKRLDQAPLFSINLIRQWLSDKMAFHLADSPQLGLIQGLTTGIRDNINQQQWQILRLSGTNHLLAISGLHIGLAAAIGFFSFRWLWSRRANNLLLLPARDVAAIGGFISALFYAGLAGFSIPTQRALIMVALVMVSLLIRRPTKPSSLLAFCLFLVLIRDPLAVLSIGFWLSFSAVAIILFTSQNQFPKPRWQWAKIHTLIAIGLSPLLVLFFGQTSLIAPVANFIAVPFISLLIVPLLLLTSIMLWLFEPIGSFLLHITDSLLAIFWPLLDYLASLPFSHWSTPQIASIYYLPITFSVLLLLSPRGTPAKWLGLIGLTPFIFYTSPQPDKGEFWFTLLDVGQGLSAVIQTKSHTLVFDAGPKFSDSFNTGTAIVQPFLHHQGIKKIDTLIISHGDNDHIGGAQPLAEQINISKILSSVPNKLTNAIGCLANQRWVWDDVYFQILHPGHNDVSSENNLSCVLRVSNSSNGFSILLTGDIEQFAEQLLIDRYSSSLQSTIMIAPHHGSKTSSSNNFIQNVSPEIVLFPTGHNNRYHFPNTDVMQRYQQKQITDFNTAIHGAIQLKSNQHNTASPTTWRQHAKRIWTSDATE